MKRLSKSLLRGRPVLVIAGLLLSAVSALAPLATAIPARAQQQSATQPIATGSRQQKMDAPESNAEEERYRHSASVAFIARVLHVSTETAARIFEDLNSGVLILVIAYFLARTVPKMLAARRAALSRELADARAATETANARLASVEARLGSLDTEIESIRQQAALDSEHDRERIRQMLEDERERVVRSAAQEIDAAEAAARRDLRKFAADLAVDRALARIQLTPETDDALIAEFTQSLAGRLTSNSSHGGQN